MLYDPITKCYHQVFSLAVVISIISLTINVTIFVPKCYACVFLSSSEQKRLFQTQKRESGSSGLLLPKKPLPETNPPAHPLSEQKHN